MIIIPSSHSSVYQCTSIQIVPNMARIDPYSASLREEQKAILNGLLGIIYDNYDTTRRIQASVDSIYRITVTLLIIIILLVIGLVFIACFVGCRRYQNENQVPLHPRKAAPIEI
ncbi:unnamed protein product [Auanema sp. JU1783]|nr:unnamed protein product [Auanema sp. JU1783]